MPTLSLQYTTMAQRVCEHAKREARARYATRHPCDAADLLMAILMVKDAPSVPILKRNGVSLPLVRGVLYKALEQSEQRKDPKLGPSSQSFTDSLQFAEILARAQDRATLVNVTHLTGGVLKADAALVRFVLTCAKTNRDHLLKELGFR